MPDKTPIGAYMKVRKAAALIDKSERWIKDEGKAGRLEIFRLGQDTVVSVKSLNEMLDNCRLGPTKRHLVPV